MRYFEYGIGLGHSQINQVQIELGFFVANAIHLARTDQGDDCVSFCLTGLAP